jgi:hypothetical protein
MSWARSLTVIILSGAIPSLAGTLVVTPGVTKPFSGSGLESAAVVAFGVPRPGNDPDKGKVNWLSSDLK